ncbi:hypothetical protein R3P38DRAFT_3329614 [Favolaschia claudopus]|uniref:Uncharacterized protein n=1 Tax=Favolaschia claudopus TaxID=2862362 RepID=A0AAV9ZYS4_9AGAR
MVATRTKTYASDTVRTSRKSLLQEAADIGASFDEQNDPTIFTAEGGGLPAVDQHALSVARIPRIRASDLAWDKICSVDWEDRQQGFVVPRITAKKEYQWCILRKLDTEYKFFPPWFDLNEDQLGPIPDEWLKDVGEDLQKAIAFGGREESN